MKSVIYAANAEGYTVQVVENSEVIYDYHAGNHRQCSDATVPLDSPNALPPNDLLGMAGQTAHEVAKARGINFNQVNYDIDLEEQLNEKD